MELTENWVLFGRDEHSVTLARRELMRVTADSCHDIKPSTKWGGARWASVLRLDEKTARCRVAKTDARRAYGRLTWLEGEYDIPFDKFIKE